MFSAILIVLRMVWVFPAVKMASYVSGGGLGHTEKQPGAREVFVMGWTGMRGVVALAAAISVPEVLANGSDVWAEEPDCVSGVLRDPGDAGGAGADAAFADSRAGAGGRDRDETRRRERREGSRSKTAIGYLEEGRKEWRRRLLCMCSTICSTGIGTGWRR